jgi:phosphate-selective porin OprO/OprP
VLSPTLVRTLFLFLAFLAPTAAAAEDDGPWRPRWQSGEAEIGFVGYVQADFRSFRDWDLEDDPLQERDLPRRARLGLEGKWKRFSFEAQADPDDGAEHLKDLFGEVRFAKAFRLRAGNFKLPVSAERLTSAAKTDFVERSRVGGDLAPGRDWGVMVHGEPVRLLEYQVGLFRGDNRAAEARAGTTVAARLVLKPWKPLDLGVSFARGDVEAQSDLSVEDPEPRGLNAFASSGFRVVAPHFVNGTRERLGLEGVLARGPVALKAEAMRVREERRGQGPDCSLQGSRLVCGDLPTLRSRAAAASFTWLVTGEKKDRTIRPRRPLGQGLGAVEIGVRAESVRFDDEGVDSGFAGVSNRARNVRERGVDALTAGLSWWPSAWTRLMANVVVERFADPLLAPEAGRRGNYVTFLTRLQIQVP